MKIAVTYDDGNIFQHFGRTETFKLYSIEDNQIVSMKYLQAGSVSHEALAGLLAEQGVDTLICGGMGAGAQAALTDAGLRIFSGASGDADEAVRAFLDGDLVSEGVNCDHEHEHAEGSGCGSHTGTESAGSDETSGCGGGCCADEESGCGGGCCGDEGSGCGGGCCGGGCHEMQILFEGPNAGKTVRTHYEGTFNDGTVFDSSYGRGEPLEFVCGTGMMIPGFDKAVVDMQVGDVVNIHLSPEDAYGPYDPNAVFTVPLDQLEGAAGLKAGDHAYLSNAMGQPFPVLVKAKDEKSITFDANHEMAGKELNFKIELVSVED
ncbi:MAG: FKBP-type peptidyl-prolyl cis-trans isomerase [Bilifractor sp.]